MTCDNNTYKEPTWFSWISAEENAVYRDQATKREPLTAQLETEWVPITKPSVPVPSLELFQEMCWDVFDTKTDNEVRDLSIWVGYMLMGFSYGELGTSWGITKSAARGVVDRIKRLLVNRTDAAESFFTDSLYLATCAYNRAQSCT